MKQTNGIDDLMNKGLRRFGREFHSSRILSNGIDDLMNKGLRLFLPGHRAQSQRVQNGIDDLMNKGLRPKEASPVSGAELPTE